MFTSSFEKSSSRYYYVWRCSRCWHKRDELGTGNILKPFMVKKKKGEGIMNPSNYTVYVKHKFQRSMRFYGSLQEGSSSMLLKAGNELQIKQML